MDEWIQQCAKEMRHKPVLNERRLWKLLRDRRLQNLKFRRQVAIGRYIVDFICLRHRLIVEADGPQHEGSAYDLARDAWLAGQGFQVLRFPNQQIESRRQEVLAAILTAAEAKLAKD